MKERPELGSGEGRSSDRLGSPLSSWMSLESQNQTIGQVEADRALDS